MIRQLGGKKQFLSRQSSEFGRGKAAGEIRTVSRGQKTEDGGQKIEDRRQKII
jgi:hypothetical protein